MATRKWNSAGSHDMNLAANYTGVGALLVTDDLVFDGTSVVDATATAGLDVKSITITPAYTGHFNDGGLVMVTHVLRGVFHCNSGGALTMKGFWSVIVSADIEILNVVGAVDVRDSYWGFLGTHMINVDIPFGDIYVVAPGQVVLSRNLDAGNVMVADGGALFKAGVFVLTADSLYAAGTGRIDLSETALARIHYNVTLEAASTFLFGATTELYFINDQGSVYSAGHAMPTVRCHAFYMYFDWGCVIRRLVLESPNSQMIFRSGHTFTISNVDPVADGWNGDLVAGMNGFAGFDPGGDDRAMLMLPAPSYNLSYVWASDIALGGGRTITVTNGESYGNNRGWIFPVQITMVEPKEGKAGDSIVLRGEGFIYAQRGGKVYVGTKEATVTYWYDSYIEFVLPTIDGEGEIAVRVINSDLNETTGTLFYVYTAIIRKKMFIALPNIPYTYNTVVDVSKANWDVPADVMIAEIRCTPAVVNFKYQMKVRTVMGDDCTVLGRAGDITKIRLNRVYRLGTNPAVRANCITVYGWMREDIKEFLS